MYIRTEFSASFSLLILSYQSSLLKSKEAFDMMTPQLYSGRSIFVSESSVEM